LRAPGERAAGGGELGGRPVVRPEDADGIAREKPDASVDFDPDVLLPGLEQSDTRAAGQPAQNPAGAGGLVAQETLPGRDEHVGPGGLAARKRRRRALHLGPDAVSGQDRHREEHAAETTPVGSAHGMHLSFFASAHRLDLDLPLSWEAVVSTGA